MVTKLGKETVGVRHNIWFRWFLLDRILSEMRPQLLGELAGRDVMDGDDKKGYCRKDWRQDKGILPYAVQIDEQATSKGYEQRTKSP